MSRARLTLLSLVAVVSAFAVLASSASAKIKFQWKVGGGTLVAGETRAFTAKADGTFDLAGTVNSIASLLLSNTLRVEPGAVIRGGSPGTNEETVVFENVTVAKPKGCVVEQNIATPTVGTIKTEPLKTEIVESQSTDEPLILFVPIKGNTFTELKFLAKTGEECALNNANAKVAGSVLAEPLPQLTEVLTGDLDFEAKTKEFLLSPGGGTVEKSGLTLGVAPTTFTGLALILLTTHELFGAF